MRNSTHRLHLGYEVFAGQYKAAVIFDDVRIPEDREFILDILYAVQAVLEAKANRHISDRRRWITGGYYLKCAMGIDEIVNGCSFAGDHN